MNDNVRPPGSNRDSTADRALTVVIPVYDEAHLIDGVIEDLAAKLDTLPGEPRVLILNNGSTDWSEALEQRLQQIYPVDVRSYYPNEGKGAMIDRALPQLDTEYAVVIDADGEYSAGDIERVLAPLQSGEADWVLGSRYGFGRRRPRQYLATYVVNKLINIWFFLLSGRRLNNLLTGLYGFRVAGVADLKLEEKRFAYTAELTWRLWARHVRMLETPISYRFRSYAEGKKIKWWETGSLLHALWRYRRPRRDSD